ncbi:YciI family protein [Ramlibacter sp.]|uniref:YciI family protein n=1 Tax=Ramlibacter sp. TaxID=1917967 RepID=UPI002FCB81EC
MKFMIMVRATDMTEAGEFPPGTDKMMAEMAAFHEEMARAGVLLDANGLQPSSEGFRIRHEGGRIQVIDGPFAESKELIAGYTLIQVRNREEALAWARRFPNPMGEGRIGEIEVRPLYGAEDFERKGIPGAERFRKLGTLE